MSAERGVAVVDEYRGPDRRRSTHIERVSPFDWTFFATAAVVALAFGTSLTDVAPIRTAGLDGEDYLAFATASVLLVAALVLVSAWRISDAAALLWTAAPFALVAVTVTLACVVASGSGGQVPRALPSACAASAVVLSLRAFFVPMIDARARRAVFSVTAATLLAVAAFAAVFELLDVELIVHDGDDGDAVAAALMAAAWGVVAALFLLRGRSERDWTFAWSGLLFVALCGTEISMATAVVERRPVTTATLLLVTTGALAAARGAVQTMHLSIAERTRELTTQARLDALRSHTANAQAAAEERAHEARNALLAVGGAIQTLERAHWELPSDIRARLSNGIVAELQRLHRLIDEEDTILPPVPYLVAEVLEPVLATAGSEFAIDTEVDAHLTAVGRPEVAAEIVQNLLHNASRHACGKGVRVTARREHDRVVITVADRGPGIPLEDRAAIFGREHRSGATGGRGLGLYISHRLAREQGGDLWVAEREGGGAVFGLELPAASSDHGPAPDGTMRTVHER